MSFIPSRTVNGRLQMALGLGARTDITGSVLGRPTDKDL